MSRLGIALALLLAAAPRPTHADPPPAHAAASPADLTAPAPPVSPEARLLLRRCDGARRERRVGLALAAVGAALTATGIAVLSYGLEYGLYDQYSAVVLGGAINLAVGASMLVTGASLSIDGQDRLADATWNLRNLPTPVLVPLRGGLSAGAQFRF